MFIYLFPAALTKWKILSHVVAQVQSAWRRQLAKAEAMRRRACGPRGGTAPQMVNLEFKNRVVSINKEAQEF